MPYQASRSFAADARQAAAARHFARHVVTGWGEECPDLDLVVGELAANAVVHAHSPFLVSIRRDDHRITIEVTDSDPELPAFCSTMPESGGGRGLLIVDQLCSSWGACATPAGGKIVWAELPLN